MPRSSESVAALASALAKAQAELTNPEKSLLATLPAERGVARAPIPLRAAIRRTGDRAQNTGTA